MLTRLIKYVNVITWSLPLEFRIWEASLSRHGLWCKNSSLQGHCHAQHWRVDLVTPQRA